MPQVYPTKKPKICYSKNLGMLTRYDGAAVLEVLPGNPSTAYRDL